MKRWICALFVAVLFIASIPAFAFRACAAVQVSQLRTVWENPFTLTTYHSNDEVNSTFFTFPKVIWNGSQYVDYILNTSDMSAGIGSVYLKVLPDHTIFYDPYQTEETIKNETWMVEHYDASRSSWETYNPVDESVHQSVNSSGIYFDRTTTLHSGATLDEWYWLRIGSEMEISVVLHPAQSGEYRLSWLLSDVSGIKAQWLTTAENVTTQLVDDRSCSRVRFASENESKCLMDWSDACFFNETAEKVETYFQELKMERNVCDSRCQARVSFGDFSLNKGESAVLDPYIVTFNSTASLDGFIEKYGVSYPPNGGTIVDTSGTVLGVGQYFVPGVQYVTVRAYLSFDTSSVPALAYNMNATLRLKTSHDSSTVDFAVQVWGGNQPVCNGNLTILSGVQPIYGDSLTAGSWGTGKVKVATWNTANYPGDGVYINLTIPSNQINKTGSTQFELNSSRDGTNAPQPNYDEGVNFYSGNSTGNEPKLEVCYSLDTIVVGTSNPVTWFYRNASTSKAVVVLFGASAYATEVRVRSIDWLGQPPNDPPEKEFGKIQFLDALIENGFSVFTPSNDSSSTHVTSYQNVSTWVQDLTMWLMYNQSYTQVYLFGMSGGAVVVGNEIQKDYASRFSAAVMNSAPVDWSDFSSQIYHTALTASKAKVATSFPEDVGDGFYQQEKEYYDNAIVDKEWHNWTGQHAEFCKLNETCLWHDRTWPFSYENDSVAVINWYSTSHPPSTPFTPTGTQTGYVSTSYSYSSGTVDSDGENVSYQFNWGDGTKNTTGFYASGTNASCNHAWSNPGSYNVTVRAQDTSQTWSCWSPPLTVSMAQNEGGGGGCPYVYDWNGTKFLKDNNILPASEAGNGTDTRDYYLLQQPLVPVFTTRQVSVYSLQIREFESEQDYIDQVKLIAVDHAQGMSIAVTPEGGIVTYQNPASPLSCVDNYGNDRLDQIGRMDGNVSDPSTFFQGYEGDWLLLDFGRVSAANANLIFRDDQKCMEYCINVQVPNGNAWQTVEVLHPRDFWAVEAVNMSAYVPVNGDFIVRLVWTAPHRLDYVGLDTSSQGQITVNSTPPALAIHSTMGDVTSKLLYDDENCVELVNGQQITLAFTLPNKAQSTTRDFILYTDGYYYTITP